MMVSGSVVQITNEKNRWYPALLIVDEIKDWGIRAYHLSITGEGVAYIRLTTGEFRYIGEARVIVGGAETL
jgi:hypothetical protein